MLPARYWYSYRYILYRKAPFMFMVGASSCPPTVPTAAAADTPADSEECCYEPVR